MRLIEWLDDERRYASTTEYVKRSLTEWLMVWVLVTVAGLLVLDEARRWLTAMGIVLIAVAMRSLVNGMWLSRGIGGGTAASIKILTSVVLVALMCGAFLWSV